MTGGGTGGHVFPALAICEQLISLGRRVTYIGSDRGMEARIVPERQIPFIALRSGAVKNKRVHEILLSLLQVLKSLFWSLYYLLRNRPKAVIGVGGYVSVPVCTAAGLLGIPVFLQEQNASVGIANRFLSLFAKEIFLGFEQALQYLPTNKCVLTGNPLRKSFYTHDYGPLPTHANHLLVFGGSQGARAINRAIVALLPILHKNFPHLQITHQTGRQDCDEIKALYEKSPYPTATVVPFIEAMAEAYSRASLVVCRSGALSVTELAVARRPAILVPYPRRGQNDQIDNAKWLATLGVAKIVEQTGEDFPKRLESCLLEALTPTGLQSLSKPFTHLHQPNALATIGHHIVSGS